MAYSNKQYKDDIMWSAFSKTDVIINSCPFKLMRYTLILDEKYVKIHDHDRKMSSSAPEKYKT